MTTVGIIGCGFVGGALKTWLEENNKDVRIAVSDPPKGMSLGRLLSPLHELNVHFRGVEEHI